MRRNNRIFGFVAICLCVSLWLNACGLSAKENTTRSIALICKSDTSEFFRSVIAGANAARSEYNVQLSIKAPETEEDYQAQNDFIREAVENGTEAIVFSAISYKDNAQAIDEAISKGVKVVVIDSDVDSAGVSLRIGTDNVGAGRKVAQAILNMEEETICVGIVNFDKVSQNGQEREMGLRQGLEEDPRVREIITINVAADETEACEQAKLLIQENPQLNVLVGLNEPLSVGVAMAVDQESASDRVRVVGFDTNVTCIDLMQQGVVTALIVQNPYAMGYLGVEMACALLNGESVASDQLMDTSTSIVTKDNMFTIESQKLLFPFG